MGRWADIVTEVRTAVGDITDATARMYVLDRARVLNAEAKWLSAPETIGSTTADVGVYTVDSDVVDIEAVRVDGVRYIRVTQNQIWDLDDAGSGTRLTGGGGVFAPAFTAAGEPRIDIRPVPSESGLVIEARQVIPLPAPADWTAENPPFPADFDQDLIHGAIALGLARVDERIAEAQYFEGLFSAAIGRLR